MDTFPSLLPPARRCTALTAGVVAAFVSAHFACAVFAAEVDLGTALVRHAPAINGGARVEGSIQQMLGQSVTLNGGATVTEDLLVPGLPTIRLNGKPVYAGTIDLDGAATPSGYQIMLNGGASLRHVVRRVDPFDLPTVAAPPLPGGNRSVTVNNPGASVGDWMTVRNLTLNGNVGQYVVPPGSYGDFVANGGSGFILGLEGAVEPAVYNFQRLTLNGQTRVDIRGPVIVTVAYGFAANGRLGVENEPSWLELRVRTGGFTLNGGCSVFGYVTAPQSTVIINGNSMLVGGLVSDRLIVNGGGLLRLRDATGINQAPVAHSQALVVESGVPLPLTLSGSDPEGAALTYTIDTLPVHGVLTTATGPITSVPTDGLTSGVLTYTPFATFTGPDSFTFRVSDGENLSEPATIAITVEAPPQPPETVPDTYLVNEGETLTVSQPGLLLNDLNPSGGVLTAQVAAMPHSGVVSVSSSGAFVYSPDVSFYGDDTFTYRAVSDGTVGPEALVSIRVNARPRAGDTTITTPQNVAVDLPLIASDPDDTALTYTVVSAPGFGSLAGTVSSGLRYIPGFQFSGTDVLTFRVTDPHGAFSTGTVTISVQGQNVAPQARISASTAEVVAPFTVNLDGSGSYDSDGQVVRYQWDLDNDGVVDFEGPVAQRLFPVSGDHDIRLTVTDDEGATGSVVHTVHLNHPPSATITAPAPRTTFVSGVEVTVEVSTSDLDGIVVAKELWVGDALIASSDSAWSGFAVSGLLPGSHELKVRVVDNRGAEGWSEPVHIIVVPSADSSGNFVVHPDLRVAGLPAARGAAEGGVDENSTSLPLLADNHFDQTVDYVATVTGDRTYGRTGYLVLDSSVTSEVAYIWDEIGFSGAKLPVSNVDDGYSEVRFSFEFPFYGREFSRVFVGSNGVLTFEDGTSRSDNESIPAPTAPAFLIAPFWTDLEPGYEYGSGYDGGGVINASAIYAQDFGDRVVIQYSADMEFWDPPIYDADVAPQPVEVVTTLGIDPEEGSGLLGVPHFNRTGRYTFQVVLHRNGDIDLVYRWMDGAVDLATIGIQNGDATDGVRLAFNEAFVSNHRTIRLRREPRGDPWFSLSGVDGSLPSGGHDDMSIRYSAKPDFAPGTYVGQIRFDHTQPGLAPYVIDVGLDIHPQVPQVRFKYPDPEGRKYFFLGESITIAVEATDDDGVVRAVSLLGNDEELAFWTVGPYVLPWTPSEGVHVLVATAIDNDGRVGESQLLTISVSEDSDNDGLPDAFEMDHFGHLGEGPLDDSDGDGWSNRKELALGADPRVIDLGTPPNAPPIPRMVTTRLSGEAPLVVRFDGTRSVDPDGVVVEWEWDLDGDGSSDDWSSVVERTYAQPGTYTVRLTVYDDEGATGSMTVPIRVRAAGTAIAPEARFEASLYAAPAARSITFDASASLDPDGSIESYAWDFGDGTTSAETTPVHYYDRVGVYPVHLTVTDEDGLTATCEKFVTITARDQGVFVERDGMLVVEAEHATQFDPRSDVANWRIVPGWSLPNEWGVVLEDASDRAAFRDQEPPGGLAPWSSAAEVGWRVRITSPGLYYYALRCSGYSIDGVVPLIRVGVDGVESTPPGGDSMGVPGDVSQFRWLRGVPLGYLEAGDHTIQIRRCQGRLLIDQMAIALDKEQLPADLSAGPALRAAVRENAPNPAPVPVIHETVVSATLPYRAMFDGSGSLAARGGISGYNWRLFQTLDPVDGSRLEGFARSVVGTDAILDLEIDDFNPPRGYGFGDEGVSLALTIADDIGQSATDEKRITFVDPLEQRIEGLGLIVDDGSIGFSAGGRWLPVGGRSLIAIREYFPGGEAEFVQKYPAMAGKVPGFSLEMRHMVGTGARLMFGGGLNDQAQFTAEVPQTGDYLVFFRWPAHNVNAALLTAAAPPLNTAIFSHDIATAASVTVNHADGSDRFLLDQRVGGGHWRFVGVHRFEAGTPATVSVGKSSEGEIVLADAVQLVPAAVVPGNQAPLAGFTWQVREDSTVVFDSSTSSDADDGILAWFWTFGDGTTSRGTRPVHRYAAPGTYAVALTVLDTHLAWHETGATVVVPLPALNDKPVARFQLSTLRGRSPLALGCDAAASTDDQGIVHYRWETTLQDEPWGGGGYFAAEGREASFVLNAPGVYGITLTVTDAHGAVDSFTLPVEVLPAGTSAQAPLPIDNRDPGFSTTGAWTRRTTFDSPAIRGAIYGHDFLEADQVGAEAVFRPTLPHAGLYQVWMRYPVAAVQPPLRVHVEHDGGDSELDLNHAYRAGEWQLMGTFRFAAGDTGSVRFARDRADQWVCADAVRWVPVGTAPQAGFQMTMPASPTVPATITFDGSASSADGAITAFEWDFGDGTVASGMTTSHTFVSEGLFSVRLTVRDERGSSDSATRLVRVRSPLSPPVVVADVQPAAGSSPLTIVFDATGSQDADGIASIIWSLGDGTSVSAGAGQHRYDRPGTYAASVVVTDVRGAAGLATFTVVVQPAGIRVVPSVAVAPSATTPRRVQFVAGGFESGDVVSWDFGDGSTASGSSVVHDYLVEGIYQVELTIERNGQLETTRRWVVVGDQIVTLPPADAPRSDPGAAFILFTPLPRL